MIKNLKWFDVAEDNYQRFLITSYENHVANFALHNSILIADAKEKIAPPEIRKGPRDVWKFIQVDDAEAGYVWFYLKKDGVSAFLMDVHLYPEFRGEGFGQQVMMMLKNDLLSRKAEVLELNVFVRNEPAVSLYKKLGFEELESEDQRVKMRWVLK